MFFFAILCCIGLLVNARDISYTIQSYTATQDCITDCINGKCITDQRAREDRCIVGTKAAWQYHTYQHRHSSKLCSSHCGKFGQDYDWCFINSKLEWDYCNPQRYDDDLKSSVLTDTGIPCANNSQHDLNYACINIDGVMQRYYDEETTYVVAKTRQGQECIGTCSTRYEYIDGHSKCYDSNIAVNNCAPPARNILAIQEEIRSFKSKVESRGSNPQGATQYTADYISFLDSSKGLISKQINQKWNAITKYIMMPAFYGNEPFLPLIVKANITRDTIPVNSRTADYSSSFAVNENVSLMRSNINIRDANRNLIAYQLGGPVALYNVVPRSTQIDVGIHSYPFESEIREDIEVNLKCVWAEVIVAVIYEDFVTEPRPVGFVVTEERYDKDNKKYHGVYDAYYNNVPSSAKPSGVRSGPNAMPEFTLSEILPTRAKT